jgi:hypothetical protein
LLALLEFLVFYWITKREIICMPCTVASNEVRTSAVSTGVGSLSVVVRERVCSLANVCQHLNLGASAVQ